MGGGAKVAVDEDAQVTDSRISHSFDGSTGDRDGTAKNDAHHITSVLSIGVARGGLRGLAPLPQRMGKNIKASLVNLTLNMRYKNDKNIKFVIT